ncbi:uncharacterized protein LOC117112468 [Anneissia japonica]|uniref:uncharacterized protein LOC117112468 n=1 Tax=Anneissia japonica TaxID=1529436 RepID=UPI0014255E84|nr:uncharacterized protein LOC117112468 [Anneissia japonica]
MAMRRSSESGSRRSRSSSISQLAVTAAEARADAAMQLARAKYAQERAAAQIEAAKANAAYESLLQEEAAAAADARSKVLQELLQHLRTEFNEDSLADVPVIEPSLFVAEYVSSLPEQAQTPPETNPVSNKLNQDLDPVVQESTQQPTTTGHVKLECTVPDSPPEAHPTGDAKLDSNVQNSSKEISTTVPVSELLQGIMKLYARRDLVTTCIPTFDDEPENFRAWKLSFKNAISGIPVSPSEETDLILNYTGAKSAEIVKRARAVHISDPAKGLNVVWERLQEKYGIPEIVTTAQINKLFRFPDIAKGHYEELRKFADLAQMVEQARVDGGLPGLNYLDTFMGVNPLVAKLPRDIQEKWRTRAFHYKEQKEGQFPPFNFFSSQRKKIFISKFVTDFAKERNDKSLMLSTHEVESKTHLNPRRLSGPARPPYRTNVLTKLTGVAKAHDNPASDGIDIDTKCPIHRTPHPLTDCRAFLRMPMEEKRSLLRYSKICFRCVASTAHIARNCKAKVSCSICGGNRHKDFLHVDTHADEAHGGERRPVLSKCTQVCRNKPSGRSCSKICLARVYIDGNPENVITTYAVLDDQSNKSLAKSKLFDLLKEEIPIPEVAEHHPHLKSIAKEIDPNADILILLGRDAPQVHKVREVRNGHNNSPWGHRLDLGWVVIGEVCIGKAHHSNTVNTFRTHVLPNGRPSCFESCTNHFDISHPAHPPDPETHYAGRRWPNPGEDVFRVSKFDNKVGSSIEDRQFLKIMTSEFSKSETGNWVAPLPFRMSRPPLPNNRHDAMKRFHSLLKSFSRKSKMKDQYLQFMTTMITKDHAEQVISDGDGERWYLPYFPVYHPKKPDKIRVVFDSSADYHGVSLNSVLMTGPDLSNNLIGVLLRFREDVVAVIADIEQMFHSFQVKEDHRDYLRFLWFENDYPDGAIVDYRMKVHTFGNSPSPAVATFGLRKTAQDAEDTFGKDAREFVNRNFYVDDGLKALPTPDKAIDLLQRTQAMLATANLRLHKIASNNVEVMGAFSSEDLDLNVQAPPIQRSLGVYWDLKRDVFTFRIGEEERPFTKRGVLAEINSIYDSIGIAAPVLIQGKLLLREMTSEKSLDWDHPLPKHTQSAWRNWQASLPILAESYIPRAYTPVPSTQAQRRELHTFVDASTQAIGAVSHPCEFCTW